MSGGFVSRAVSYAAGSQLRDASRQHLPSWAGGHGNEAGQRGKETDSRLGARLRAESVLAASKAAGAGGVAAVAGAAGAAGAAAGAASSGRPTGSNGQTSGAAAEHQAGWLGRLRGSGNPRAYSPPPLAGADGGGVAAGGGGLQRPSWRQEDFDAEMLEASLREQHQPVSAEQANSARDSLAAATQAAVGSLIADQGPRARQHLAYQALGEWTPQEREAVRTLAAASPEVRAQAFAEGGGSTTGFGESAEVVAGRASTSAAGAAAAPGAAAGEAANGGTRLRSPQDQPRPTDGSGA